MIPYNMKIRIKSNSIRLRLTKSEVEKISAVGYVEERTQIGDATFVYALQAVDTGNDLSAVLTENRITMYVPEIFVKEWPENDITGFTARNAAANNETLTLLLEKDFVCLDETTEDQSDNYENPKAIINV